MCTVTYIPQVQEGYILSSNRDENAARSPRNLTFEEAGRQRLLFPRDTAAGGTWIALSDANRVVCLLNGAFEKHRHEPPYRRSRGIMVLDFFGFPSAEAFARNYDFEGMEPFTMVIVDAGQLSELRWDEKDVHFRLLDPQGYHIWSSTTLYPPPIQEKRNRWFAEWLEEREDFSLEAIQQFHFTGGDGDPYNDFIMDREGRVQTVSITNVVKTQEEFRMIYHDLLREQVTARQLGLRQAVP